MRFALLGAFVAGLAGCMLLPHARTVSATNSRTAAGYDHTDELLESSGAAAGARDSKHLLEAAREVVEARSTAQDTLALVDQMKRDGSWRSGLQYRVRNGKVLGEEEILAALAGMRERAKREHARLEHALDEAYQHEYPSASDAQLAALHEMGPPTAITMRTARRPPPPPPPRSASKRRRTHSAAKATQAIAQPCWTWDNDEALTTTCWKPDGTVASHVAKQKPRTIAPPPEQGDDVAAAPSDEPPAGGEPEGGESQSKPATEEPAPTAAPTGSTCKPDGAESNGSQECCSHKTMDKYDADRASHPGAFGGWVCCSGGPSCT